MFWIDFVWCLAQEQEREAEKEDQEVTTMVYLAVSKHGRMDISINNSGFNATISRSSFYFSVQYI